MITYNNINICIKYNLSVDWWLHTASSNEKSSIEDHDWYVILSYIDNVALARKGFLADSYVEKNEADTMAECESEEVYARLRLVASQFYENSLKERSLLNKWLHKLVDKALAIFGV
ncbi:hypothetical protein I2I05_16470 [Hymenobacter sp. BT683]|uniref:Uncharacterized protein n=1 Tax=Hymenobacter jeongseonensis TaxID=2791027 RepID=A0ABS0IKU9_9BACT|nr:hypothetical protein [Hymenobacter jeongseonensis]